MRRYREILTLPGALNFCVAGLVARSGSAMMGLGLVLMVSALYNSYGLAGAVVAANAVAWAIGTAGLSRLAERHGQRAVMLPAAIISSVALAALVGLALLQAPAWMLFVPAVISGVTAGSPGAMVRARWNHVVSDPELLHTAFSLESTLDEVTYVIGPILATVLATSVHPAAGLVAPVVLLVVGATWLYGQHRTQPPAHPVTETAVRHRPALLLPGVWAVVAVNLLIGAMFGAVEVGVVAAATDWDARAWSGLVLGLSSVASGAAGFFYGARSWRSRATSRFLLGVAGMFAAALLLPLVTSLPLLTVVIIVFGVSVAPTLITGSSLISYLAPEGRLTESLGLMSAGIGIGASIGSGVAGHLIDLSGPTAGLATVTGFGALTVAIALISLRRLRSAVSLSVPATTAEPDGA